MKNTSIWKRYQFCGGAQVFGTECYIDELTDVVHCTCKKEENLKGFDWMKQDYHQTKTIIDTTVLSSTTTLSDRDTDMGSPMIEGHGTVTCHTNNDRQDLFMTCSTIVERRMKQWKNTIVK